MEEASAIVVTLKGSEKYRPPLHTEDKDHRLKMKDDLSPLPAIVLMNNQLLGSTKSHVLLRNVLALWNSTRNKLCAR
jgi:hypothetical protein